jgi:molybdenum cofactor cytidylyltransferase
MGRPKLLLPWGKETILEHLINQWRGLGASQVAIVCAAQDAVIPRELDRIGFATENRILNPTPQAGMFSSIQCAARWPGWKPALDHIAVVLGDQPHLRTKTLEALRDFAREHPHEVCQPGDRGQPHHPVVLPLAEFRRAGQAIAPDLRSFLQNCRVAICDVHDPGLTLDLDTPSDYEEALKLAFPD